MVEKLRTSGHPFFRFAREVSPPIAKGIGAGVGIGLAAVGAITERNHRELTHRSLVLSPTLQAIIDAEEHSIGMEPTIWASVHRLHHHFPDVSLRGFFDVARAINWVVKNQVGAIVPGSYKFLDPYVEEFTKEQVLQIGKLAENELRKRLGDRYEEANGYSPEELDRILKPQEPLYAYPNFEKKIEEYSFDAIAQILLTDPHSPSLQPFRNGHKNGVRSVLWRNVPDYKRAGNLFKAQPDLKPEDLKTDKDVVNPSYKKEILRGFAVVAGGALLLRRKFKPEDFLIAAAAGSAANGVKMLVQIIGGNVTNALGHDGPLTLRELVKALTSRDYECKLNPDGSVSTNTVDAGWIGYVLNLLTLDEVGGQGEHHDDPGKIAYTSKDGIDGVIDTPWGSFSSYLANSKWFPLLKPGKGFDLAEGEGRPDEPNEAVKLIWQARVDQMKLHALEKA